MQQFIPFWKPIVSMAPVEQPVGLGESMGPEGAGLGPSGF